MADGNVKIRRRSKSKHVAPIPAVKPTYEVPKWYELLFFISIYQRKTCYKHLSI